MGKGKTIVDKSIFNKSVDAKKHHKVCLSTGCLSKESILKYDSVS